jgi:hypothetical protein
VDLRLAKTLITPNPSRFASLQDFDERSSARLQERIGRWEEFSRQLRRDPRVVAYYPFEREPTDDRVLREATPDGKERPAGSIVGANWSEGRWRGKDALEFKRPGDRVRVSLPGQFESLTLTAWIRVDGFDNGWSSLILSDGWKRPGALHWQIEYSGRIELAVFTDDRHDPNSRSPVALGPYDLGRWMHLAVVYDRNRKQVTHHLDGVAFSRCELPVTVPLSIRNAEIGNWNTLAHPDINPIRNFNGRMDELVIFREALSAEEIARFYEVGRPQP